MKKKEIKKVVRKKYAQIAKAEGSCCGSSSCSCESVTAEQVGRSIGYSKKDLSTAPAGSNLGLGCGNPVAIASLKAGETVLDLGSGAGFDAFLAAKKVGRSGRVIGVDMTPAMIAKARANARKGNFKNVEFKLGEIEKLPLADSSINAIISNCVINLSPDKPSVFKEAFRVLRPGGRLMVSDLVLEKELPKAIKDSVEAYVGCIAGAEMKDKYLALIKQAGFKGIRVVACDRYLGYPVASIKIRAVKP